MSNATQLFHSRDLIKYLPDLLDGDDPILKRPEAKEILRTDPLAEDALLAVGRAVNVYRLGRRERLRPARKVVGSIEVARPILTAVDCLTRQLADVLADHATYLVHEGLSDRWTSLSDRPEYVEDSYPARLKGLAEMAADLGTSLPWPPEHFPDESRSAQLESARQLVSAFRDLAPTRDPDLVSFYLLLIREERQADVQAEHWIELANATTAGSVAHHALNHAATALCSNGEPLRAAELSKTCLQIWPMDAICAYKGMAITARAGDHQTAVAYSDLLGAAHASDWYYKQVILDSAHWNETKREHPLLVETLLASLPATLGSAILKAVDK